jgi:hypothetical protein
VYSVIHRLARMRSRKKLNVVFVIHFRPYWPTLEPIYKAMLNSENFNPIVIAVSDEGRDLDPILTLDDVKVVRSDIDNLSEFLSSRGIKHLNWNHYVKKFENDGIKSLQSIQPDILFRQTHYEHSMPPEFKVSNLVNVKICYLPYEFEIAEVPHVNVEQELFQKAWKIFAPSSAHEIYYKTKNNKLNLEMNFHPKLEVIAENSEMRGENLGRKRVLWAPHHSVSDDWLRFGTFHQIYRDFCNFVMNNSHIDFVLRGHHLLFDYVIKYEKLTTLELEEFLSTWEALPNAFFDRNPDYADSFAESDILFTDGISFLAEYQVTKKPLVFLEREGHEALTRVGEHFVEGTYSCSSLSSALEMLESFSQGSLESKYGRRVGKADELLSANRNSAQQICETILRDFYN